LQRWVADHARNEDIPTPRLQRWISYMVVAAALESARDERDDPLFVLKGGVAMELRLGLKARATRDYDAAFRDRADDMLARLDEALRAPPGDFTITRAEPRSVPETGTLRMDLKLAYRERSWATVRLEIAPVEGAVGREIDRVPAISLDPFGLEGP